MSMSRAQIAFAAATLFPTPLAQGASISASFNVSSAQLTTLYSATFDGACGAQPPGSFFQCLNPVAGAVAITPSAGGGGSITLVYDDSTGEVTEITNLDFYVSDMTIVIGSISSGTATATARVTSGNSVPVVNDFPFLKAGTAGSNGTADADQNAAVGIFQHDAPGVENDATSFPKFANIVDTCVGTLCSLIPILNFDAVRYEIHGTVIGSGFNGVLRAETAHNSNFFVNFSSTAAVVPVPAAAWLLGAGLGLLGLVRRRAPVRSTGGCPR